MEKKTEEAIKETSKKLLDFLEVEANLILDKDEEEVYHLRLESPEAGLLIGYHGETLESFQLILGLMIYKKLGSWKRIVIHIGDYREKKEAALREMAEQTAQEVLLKKEAVVLPGLTSAERRVIHLVLSEREDLLTFSEGEGKDRHLVIKPKEKTDAKT